MLSCVVDNTKALKDTKGIKGFKTHDAAVLAVVREIGPVECEGVVDVHIIQRQGYYFPVLSPESANDLQTLKATGFAVC